MAVMAASYPLLPAVRAASARFGLLQRVGGEDAERHRESGFKRYLLQSPRRFTRHVIEVRRLASNHGSQRNNAIVPTALSEHFRRQRQLKRAGTRNTSNRSACALLRASRAPSSSRSVIALLKRAATIANLSPRASPFHCIG